MAETTMTGTGAARPDGLRGVAADWASDQRAFKNVSWGKAMMWIFLLSDTFIFGSFLLSYMTARMSTRVPWPNPSEVFALHIGGQNVPLILIAIMTFVLISSSGTMAMAVNYRLPPRPPQDSGAYAFDRRAWRDLRRHAGVRVDEADQRGRPAVGKSLGGGAIRVQLLHDHRLPRNPCDVRRHFPADRGAKGLARRL